MYNTFIIQRDHFDQQKEAESKFDIPWVAIPHKTMQLLHFYIIENEDGSAEFLKNRAEHKKIYSPMEYKQFRKEYLMN